MLFRRIAFGFVVVLLLTTPASAGQGFIPPPPPPKCSPCVPPHEQLTKLEARRAALRAAIAQAEARLEQLQKEIAADLAAVAEAKKIVVPADLAGSGIAELDQRIAANAMQQAFIRINKEEDEADLRGVETEIRQLLDELNRCNQTCTAGDPPPDPFNLAGGTPLEAPADGLTPAPAPACEPCEPPAEELKRLEEERRQLSEQIERLDAEIGELEAENAREQRSIEQVQQLRKNPKYANHQNVADEMVGRARQRIADNTKTIDAKRGARGSANQRRTEIDQRLPELGDEVNKCNSSCSLRTNKTWYWVGAGGGGLAAIVAAAAGSSTTPAVVSAPLNPPAPVTNTQPQSQPPQPQPDPFASLAGVHDCLECSVTSDPLRHDLVIRFCDRAGGPWDVAIASISIRHAPPFVNAEGLPIDGAGNFRADLRGMVADIPNVGITIAGTADPATGRIRFTYTMGTGGELPGRGPVTYALTLQKRR